MGTSRHGMLGVPKRSVHIEWQAIDDGYDPRWDWSSVLYAYLAHGRLRYIGKAEGTTVWVRMCAPDKDRHVESLERLTDHKFNGVGVLVGVPRAEAPHRVTYRCLRDLEALLIRRLQPPDNKTGKGSHSENSPGTRSRRKIRFPGMSVACEGDWPFQRNSFINK